MGIILVVVDHLMGNAARQAAFGLWKTVLICYSTNIYIYSGTTADYCFGANCQQGYGKCNPFVNGKL